MKFLLLITFFLIHFPIHSQCDYAKNWQNGEFDLSCCDRISSKSKSDYNSTYFIEKYFLIKCQIWNRKFSKAISQTEELLNELKTKRKHSEVNDNLQKEIYFNTLILGYNLTKESLNYTLRKKYQVELNNLICHEEKYLLDYINQFCFYATNFRFKINDVLSYFDFYLSSSDFKICNNNKSKKLLLDIIDKTGYKRKLLNASNDEHQETNFLFGSDTPLHVKFKLNDITYVVFEQENFANEFFLSNNYECDTIIAYDYFPLEQMRAPVFLSYKRKDGTKPNYNFLVQNINLIRILSE